MVALSPVSPSLAPATNYDRINAAITEATKVSSKQDAFDLAGLLSSVSQRALQSDLAALTGTVNSKASGASVTALQDALSGKASQSSVSSLTNSVAALTTVVNGKAAQSDLASLTQLVNMKATQAAVDALSALVATKIDATQLGGIKPIFRASGTLVQAKAAADAAWTTLFDYALLQGPAGLNPEIGIDPANQTSLRWRLAGGGWNPLFDLALLKGRDGRDGGLYPFSRPGVGTTYFTSDTTLRDPMAFVSLDPAKAVGTAEGVGYDLTGQGHVVSKQAFPVEPDAYYGAEIAFIRRTAPSDPSGDTFRFALLCYGANGNALAPVVVQDWANPPVGVRQSAKVFFSRLSDADRDPGALALPAGTVMVRPDAQAFGGTQSTVLISLRWLTTEMAATSAAIARAASATAVAAAQQAASAAVNGSISKPTLAELNAAKRPDGTDYPEGTLGRAETGAGAGEYVRRGGAWVYTGPTTATLDLAKADRSVIDQVAGDGFDLIDTRRRRWGRFTAGGEILLRWLRQTSTAGGFRIRDTLRRQPFAVTEEGVRIGALVISGAGRGLLVLTTNRRVIARLDASGLFLPGYPSLAKVASLISSAVPTPQVAAPILGAHLFCVTGSRQTLNPRSIQPIRQDTDQSAITLASQPSGAGAAEYVRQSEGGPIEIDTDRLGSTAEVVCRPRRGNTILYSLTQTVRRKAVPVSGSPAPRIAFNGDSITNRQSLQIAQQFLTGWGFAPVFMGSVPSSASATFAGDSAGPLGEGREGWATSDFFGLDSDDVLGVIASGEEATYLGYDKVTRSKYNVFLRPPTGSDPANRIFTGPFGSYVFDYGFYLGRWSGTSLASTFASAPTAVVINLAMNDVLEKGTAGPAQMAQLLPIMVESIRAALPSVPILFWASVTGRSPQSDTQWATGLAAAQQTVVGLVASLRAGGDPNVYFVNVHAAQAPDAGFSTTATLDPVTGFATATASDTIHPMGVNRITAGRMLAEAIANVG